MFDSECELLTVVGKRNSTVARNWVHTIAFLLISVSLQQFSFWIGRARCAVIYGLGFRSSFTIGYDMFDSNRILFDGINIGDFFIAINRATNWIARSWIVISINQAGSRWGRISFAPIFAFGYVGC